MEKGNRLSRAPDVTELSVPRVHIKRSISTESPRYMIRMQGGVVGGNRHALPSLIKFKKRKE